MRKILHWLDDEAHSLKSIITQIQNNSDISVRTYKDESTFFRDYRQFPVEVIFLDFYLGNSQRNGLDILKRIRQEKINSRVVVISGMLDIEITKKLIFAGASDVFEKKSPITIIKEVFTQMSLAEVNYQSSKAREAYNDLNQKQKMICDAMIDRLSNSEIVEKTKLGYSNVRKYKGQIFNIFRSKGYSIKNSRDFSKIFKGTD